MPGVVTFWSDEKLAHEIEKLEKAGAPSHKYGPLPGLLAERDIRRQFRSTLLVGAPYQPPADDGQTPSSGDDPFR